MTKEKPKNISNLKITKNTKNEKKKKKKKEKERERNGVGVVDYKKRKSVVEWSVLWFCGIDEIMLRCHEEEEE